MKEALNRTNRESHPPLAKKTDPQAKIGLPRCMRMPPLRSVGYQVRRPGSSFESKVSVGVLHQGTLSRALCLERVEMAARIRAPLENPRLFHVLFLWDSG